MMERSPFQYRFWLLLSLLLAGCQDQAPSQTQINKIKLVDQPQAVIQERPQLELIRTLLDEDFSAGIGDWQLSTSLSAPLTAEPGVLEVSFPQADGNSVLRLGGRRGVLYRLIPVQPSSAYVFRARLRSNNLKAGPDFENAKPFVAELSAAGTREELMATPPSEPLLVVRHLFETCLGTSGWQSHERTFVTSAKTKTLLVVANYSFTDGIESGSIDFDDFSLEQVPLRVAWNQKLEAALADYARGEEPHGGWRDERLVRGYLGAEVRPSILSFPEQSTGFLLDLPQDAPRMESGVGPWPAAMLGGANNNLTYEILINGESIWSQEQATSERTLEDGWLDFELDLSNWAGQRVELVLRSSGDLPALFGSPIIRGSTRQPGKQNLILISLDTLRADYVGCYGAPGNPTPRLDAFAAAGIRCAQVDAQAPYTLPGHATMFSGQYPTVHGAQRPSQVFSGSRSPILARLLSNAGYRTEAFTGGALMNADFGFDKGFDRFANIDPLRHKQSAFFQAMLADDPVAKQRLRRNRQGPARVTPAMIDRYGPAQLDAWLGQHQDEPFFLFVHTYSVHDYDPPAEFLNCRAGGCTVQRTDYNEFRLTRKHGWNPQPISDAERDHMRHLYDGTVRQVDFLVGRLLDRVKELGLDQNTIIAIATDHGEEMLERGFQQHGKTLYEEMLRLPLMLRIPGEEPRVIQEPVMMIDLAPTLLAALGLPADARMNGRNLLQPVPSDRITFSEIHDDFVHKYALRTPDGYKIIYAPKDEDVSFPAENEWELFLTTEDREEQHNLAGTPSEPLLRLQAAMHEQRARLQAISDGLGAVGNSNVSESSKGQLNELGYADNIED